MAKYARTKWNVTPLLLSSLCMRISSILKPEQWDRDDRWRAAICLVRGLPIIMCQLNLTTVHYSGLRMPTRTCLSLPLSLSLHPSSTAASRFHHLSFGRIAARANRQQLSSRVAIQLLFNIIGASLESSCLCGALRDHIVKLRATPAGK